MANIIDGGGDESRSRSVLVWAKINEWDGMEAVLGGCLSKAMGQIDDGVAPWPIARKSRIWEN